MRLSFTALLFFAASLVLTAQDSKLYVVTYVDLTPNFADDGSKVLQKYASDTRKEKGVARFELFLDIGRKNHFTMVGAWQNRAAFDEHLEADHTKQFREKLQPMLGSPMDERLYNILP
jgi:quinol monooxygenase YgiN